LQILSVVFIGHLQSHAQTKWPYLSHGAKEPHSAQQKPAAHSLCNTSGLLSVRTANRLWLMRNESRPHNMPNHRTRSAPNGGGNQWLECESRNTATPNNAAGDSENQRTTDGNKDPKRGTITAFDDFAGDEPDQQADNNPTSDDSKRHGLLQKKANQRPTRFSCARRGFEVR
jgi:hypothetical protein